MTALSPSAFLIDLDDTIYDEKQFVLSGYKAVSKYLEKHAGLNRAEAYDYLWYVFLKFGRSGAFNRVIEKYSLDADILKPLIKLYRDHTPQIDFYEGSEETLKYLRKIGPVAIVTDGAASVQRKKIEALGLHNKVDDVVLCDAVGAAKPDVKGFKHAANALGVDINKCIIIGDDPMHDMLAAHRLDIPAIRVMTGRFTAMPTPEHFTSAYSVSHFSSVPDFLKLPK